MTPATEIEQLRAQIAALTHLLETHEQVVAEQTDRLASERDRLLAVVRDLPAATAVLEGADLVFRFANELFTQTVGGRHVVGLSVRAAFPEIEGQGYFELLEHVYRSGESLHAQESKAMIERNNALEEVYFNYAYVALRGASGAVEGVLIHAVEVTELVRARERERLEAEMLQKSLLPPALPEVPELDVATRYRAGGGARVGGDWYDVFRLADGRLACTLGDVAGHGSRAASVMGQIRMAVRAYAYEGHSPSEVILRTDRLLQSLGRDDMATMVFVVFDALEGKMTLSSAGHPPPLLARPGGGFTFVACQGSPPLGVVPDARYRDFEYDFEPDDVLLLYSDGLVEVRGRSLDERLHALASAVDASAERTPENICDDVMSAMLDSPEDDVAVVAVRAAAMPDDHLVLQLTAEPENLRVLRRSTKRWLMRMALPKSVLDEILLALSEATANVVEHAYRGAGGEMIVEARVEDEQLVFRVVDRGRWGGIAKEDGGRGLGLMQMFMDQVEIERRPDGTIVEMSKRVDRRGNGAA